MPKGLHVLPGIEFCSELGGSESVHFIGIFPDNADLGSIWTKIQGQCNLTKADIEKRGGYSPKFTTFASKFSDDGTEIREK